MALALHILLTVLVIVLGIIGVVIVTPFQIRIRGGRQTGLGHVQGYIGVPLRILGFHAYLSETTQRYCIYLLGIPVRRRLIPFEKLAKKRGNKAKEAKPKKEKPKPKAKSKKSATQSLDDMRYILRTPHVRTVAGRLFGLLNPKGEIDAEVGFDDPSITGTLAGIITFLEGIAPGLRLNVRYNFTDAELKGHFLFGATIWIPQIIAGAAATALSKEGRALIVHLWGFRKRKPARAA